MLTETKAIKGVYKLLIPFLHSSIVSCCSWIKSEKGRGTKKGNRLKDCQTRKETRSWKERWWNTSLCTIFLESTLYTRQQQQRRTSIVLDHNKSTTTIVVVRANALFSTHTFRLFPFPENFCLHHGQDYIESKRKRCQVQKVFTAYYAYFTTLDYLENGGRRKMWTWTAARDVVVVVTSSSSPQNA